MLCLPAPTGSKHAYCKACFLAGARAPGRPAPPVCSRASPGRHLLAVSLSRAVCDAQLRAHPVSSRAEERAGH